MIDSGEVLQTLKDLSPWVILAYLFIKEFLPVIIGNVYREKELESRERLEYLNKYVEMFNGVYRELQMMRVDLAKLSQTNLLLISLLNKEEEEKDERHPSNRV